MLFRSVTTGDYLLGFLLGTREALSQNARASLTITLPAVDERSLGALIALFERAVGLYAQLIGVNAYHQPGVEAGKRAAGDVLALHRAVLAALRDAPHTPRTAADLAEAAGSPERSETVHQLLEHLAANGRVRRTPGEDPTRARYQPRSEP